MAGNTVTELMSYTGVLGGAVFSLALILTVFCSNHNTLEPQATPLLLLWTSLPVLLLACGLAFKHFERASVGPIPVATASFCIIVFVANILSIVVLVHEDGEDDQDFPIASPRISQQPRKSQQSRKSQEQQPEQPEQEHPSEDEEDVLLAPVTEDESALDFVEGGECEDKA